MAMPSQRHPRPLHAPRPRHAVAVGTGRHADAWPLRVLACWPRAFCAHLSMLVLHDVLHALVHASLSSAASALRHTVLSLARICTCACRCKHSSSDIQPAEWRGQVPRPPSIHSCWCDTHMRMGCIVLAA